MTVMQLEPGARIAGSDVFDLAVSWRGLRINTLCNALSDMAGRASFRADEEAFLARFALNAWCASATSPACWKPAPTSTS